MALLEPVRRPGWRVARPVGGSLFFGVLFVFAFRWALRRSSRSWPTRRPGTDRGWRSPNWAIQQFGWFGDLRAWSASSAIWFLVAFFGVVRFLTYIDQRIRLEGWEIELRLPVAGAAMEDAERW